jgi:hypothetical protein
MTRLIEGVGITLRWVTLHQIEGNPGSRIVGAMLTRTYGASETLWRNDRRDGRENGPAEP